MRERRIARYSRCLTGSGNSVSARLLIADSRYRYIQLHSIHYKITVPVHRGSCVSCLVCSRQVQRCLVPQYPLTQHVSAFSAFSHLLCTFSSSLITQSTAGFFALAAWQLALLTRDTRRKKAAFVHMMLCGQVGTSATYSSQRHTGCCYSISDSMHSTTYITLPVLKGLQWVHAQCTPYLLVVLRLNIFPFYYIKANPMARLAGANRQPLNSQGLQNTQMEMEGKGNDDGNSQIRKSRRWR